jgi:GT2 family glycosyltransferase
MNPEKNKHLEVAVVILNWNGKDYLKHFLPKIIEYSGNVDNCEIIVADNGSIDDSVKFMKANFPSVGLIELEKNHGFSEGYNRALEVIDSKYFVLLNSDVEVTPDWLLNLYTFMEDTPNAAACMPKLKNYSERDMFEYAGASGGYIDMFGYPFCRGRILNVIEQDNGQYDDNIRIFWASGACMMVRSSVYKKLEGLDGGFFAHMEEIDFCWRVKNTGYEIWVVPVSIIYHIGGGTLPKENPDKIFLNYRNSLLCLFKNLSKEKVIWILPFRMMLDIASAGIYLFTGRITFFFAVLKAHMAFFHLIPKYRKKRIFIQKMSTIKSHDEILKKSILYLFFVKKIEEFKNINWHKPEKVKLITKK